MKVSIFYFTENGKEVGLLLKSLLQEITYRGDHLTLLRFSSCKEEVKEAFLDSKVLIFISATGIAMRLAGPLLKDKTVDPAILVMDEGMQFVIPLASGHIGGANGLSRLLAERVNATAVITTATDVEGVFSVDEFAVDNQLAISDKRAIQKIAKKFLNKEPVNIAIADDIIISSEKKDQEEALLHLMMRPFVVGMGCKKNKSFEEVESFFLETLEKLQISLSQVIAFASIDVKKEEEAFIKLTEKYQLPFITYSAEELCRVEGDFETSAFVEEMVGVGEVSGRSAKKCGGVGKFVLTKEKKDGMTISVFEKYRRITLQYE